LDLKLQIFQRGIMPTVLSAFTVLTPIHINNVGAETKRERDSRLRPISGAELALIQLFDGRLSKKEIKIKEIEAAHQCAGAHVTSSAWKAVGLPQARAIAQLRC